MKTLQKSFGTRIEISEVAVSARTEIDYDTGKVYWNFDVSVYRDGVLDSYLSDFWSESIDWELFFEIERGAEYGEEIHYSLVDDETYFVRDLESLLGYRLGR